MKFQCKQIFLRNQWLHETQQQLDTRINLHPATLGDDNRLTSFKNISGCRVMSGLMRVSSLRIARYKGS
jgi:hypothetical protein